MFDYCSVLYFLWADKTSKVNRLMNPKTVMSRASSGPTSGQRKLGRSSTNKNVFKQSRNQKQKPNNVPKQLDYQGRWEHEDGVRRRKYKQKIASNARKTVQSTEQKKSAVILGNIGSK